MDSNENQVGRISPDQVKKVMNEVLLPIPAVWISVISVAIVISLFEITPAAGGIYTVTFRLTWVTVLLLALVWLPFLLKVLALGGGSLKAMGGEATFEGVGEVVSQFSDEVLSQLPPEEQRQVLPSFIAATKRTEETSTESDQKKLQKVREDLEKRLAALSETGTLYEQLRSDMPSGPARTLELEKVMAKARAIARNTDVSPSEARELFERGSPGERITALALAQENRNPEFFTLVIEAIRDPRSPFEQYHALGAAELMLPELNEAQKQQLVDSINDQRSGVIHKLRNRLFGPDTDREAVSDRILNAIDTK
jgi:hypothetical protein